MTYETLFFVLRDTTGVVEDPRVLDELFGPGLGMLIGFAYILAPIVFAYYLYRFGVWLFVEQGPGSGKHGQTHISIASPDH
jgi:hypothetical protein